MKSRSQVYMFLYVPLPLGNFIDFFDHFLSCGFTKLWFFGKQATTYVYSVRHSNSLICTNSTKLIRKNAQRLYWLFLSKFKLNFVCIIHNLTTMFNPGFTLFLHQLLCNYKYSVANVKSLYKNKSNIEHSSFQMKALEWFAEYFEIRAEFYFSLLKFYNCFLKRRHTTRAISLATGC